MKTKQDFSSVRRDMEEQEENTSGIPLYMLDPKKFSGKERRQIQKAKNSRNHRCKKNTEVQDLRNKIFELEEENARLKKAKNKIVVECEDSLDNQVLSQPDTLNMLFDDVCLNGDDSMNVEDIEPSIPLCDEDSSDNDEQQQRYYTPEVNECCSAMKSLEEKDEIIKKLNTDVTNKNEEIRKMALKIKKIIKKTKSLMEKQHKLLLRAEKERDSLLVKQPRENEKSNLLNNDVDDFLNSNDYETENLKYLDAGQITDSVPGLHEVILPRAYELEYITKCSPLTNVVFPPK